MEIGKKLDTLGLVLMAYGVLQLLVALLVGVVYGLMGVGMIGLGASEGDGGLAFAGGIFALFAVLIGFMLLLYTAMYVAAGWGLRKRKAWARVVALIGGALALLNIPLGTALGIYAFMVLLDDKVAGELTG
jgi:hypothetical protein